MADEKMLQAQKTYNTICSMLRNKGWKFEERKDDLIITCGACGDDLPMDIIICVRPENQVVSLFSPLPFKIESSKMIDCALAVCVANNGLINGSFDYDIADGKICFRVATSYRDAELSEAIFNYMLMISVITVDEYNDKFLMISKGVMSIEQFIEFRNKK